MPEAENTEQHAARTLAVNRIDRSVSRFGNLTLLDIVKGTVEYRLSELIVGSQNLG
jgi:hypothetical protein